MEQDEKKKRKKKVISPNKNEVAFKDIEPKFVGVKDNYLPCVLVKLGVCSNNSEARQYIRSTGVLLNGIQTNSCDVVSEGLKIEQFELAVEGGLYHIFLI